MIDEIDIARFLRHLFDQETIETTMPFEFRTQDLPRIDLAESSVESFSTWEQCWKDYFDLSGLAEVEDKERQVRVLRMCFLGDTLKIVKNLGITATESDGPNPIIDAMRRHVRGSVNLWTEMHNFQKRYQYRDEPIKDYVISLRSLASTCEFPADLGRYRV